MNRNNKERAEFVVQSFRDMDIRLRDSCRIMRYHNVFTKGKPDIEFGTSRFFLALEAMRELHMFEFIFDQANDPNDKTFRKLVSKCIKDSALAEEDVRKERTPGRDSQFELYIAAACKAARLTPVEHSSPDVLFSIGNLRYCIEAKRPKSIEAIDSCLHDASVQIRESGLAGFIAIDTSAAFALERDEPPVPELDEVWELMRQWRMKLTPFPDDYFAQVHYRAMCLVIGEFKEEMNRRMAGRNVLGIVFNDQMPRIMQDHEWGLTGATVTYPTSEGPEFEIVAGQFKRGLPGQLGDPG